MSQQPGLGAGFSRLGFPDDDVDMIDRGGRQTSTEPLTTEQPLAFPSPDADGRAPIPMPTFPSLDPESVPTADADGEQPGVVVFLSRAPEVPHAAPVLPIPPRLREVDIECGICRDVMQNPLVLPCMHLFCRECITQWYAASSESHSNFECPSCRYIVRDRTGEIHLPAEYLLSPEQNAYAGDDDDANDEELHDMDAVSELHVMPARSGFQDQDAGSDNDDANDESQDQDVGPVLIDTGVDEDGDYGSDASVMLGGHDGVRNWATAQTIFMNSGLLDNSHSAGRGTALYEGRWSVAIGRALYHLLSHPQVVPTAPAYLRPIQSARDVVVFGNLLVTAYEMTYPAIRRIDFASRMPGVRIGNLRRAWDYIVTMYVEMLLRREWEEVSHSAFALQGRLEEAILMEVSHGGLLGPISDCQFFNPGSPFSGMVAELTAYVVARAVHQRLRRIADHHTDARRRGADVYAAALVHNSLA